MRICLINNLYKPFDRGGAERVAEAMAEEFLRTGHEIHIVSTRPYGREDHSVGNRYCFPSLYYDLGKLPVFFRLLWHIADMVDIINFFRLIIFLKKSKIEAVISHNLKGIGYLAPLAIRALGLKHLHVLHDIQLIHPSGLMSYGGEDKIDGFFSRIYGRLNRLIFGSPTAVIAPSRWLLEMHTGRDFFRHSRTSVIGNPTSADKQTGVRTPGKKISFLYVGQLEAHKGLDILLDANRLLRDDMKGKYEIIIVGEGSLDRSAEAREEIKWAGRKLRSEVFEYMLRSDCLIVPSVCYENSPTVIYEAFSANLPVIASNLGGISELFAGSDDLLFRPDAPSLACKMEWVIADPTVLIREYQEIRKKSSFLGPSDYLKEVLRMLDGSETSDI